MNHLTLLLPLALLTVPSTVVRADVAANAARPNIVILFIDDLGYADTGRARE